MPEACRWCRADTYRLCRCPRCGEPAEPQARWRPPEQVEADDLRARLLVDLRVQVVLPAPSTADVVRALVGRQGPPALREQAAQELLVSVLDAPGPADRDRVCLWAERHRPDLVGHVRACAWGAEQAQRWTGAAERPGP